MDQDFLLGVFAVQLGLAKPGQVMAAASAWLADPSESIPDRLVASGALDEAKRAMLAGLASEAVKSHGGDVKKTLQTLGGDQLLLRSFGGSVVLDGEGKLSAQENPAADSGETTDVAQEHPGKYTLRGGSAESAEIGRGGLGRVLVAVDEHLGREVAIKELLNDGSGSSSALSPGALSATSAAVSRFLREARVTGQLEHPNIVPVYEVGQRADGTYFYAMRVVRGQTLGDRLKKARTLADRLALLPHYVNLCNAVAYAHSRHVVHRDIKPDNVMIGEFGETVVLDWGLAKVRGKQDMRSKEIRKELKLLHEAGAGQTVDGSAVGTPAYMSPEQADGRLEEIDERSDVWGLGAVLYELLSGRPPFEGITPYEILGKVLKDPVAPVASHEKSAPPELAAVAEKALSRDRAHRYPTAKELADEIEAYLQGQRVGAYSYGSWELVKRFVAKNKALSLGVAAVFLTLAVASVVVFMAWGREQEARAAAEKQEKATEEQRREATTNLAQGYVNKAQSLVLDRKYNAAYVYAAAALREYQTTGRRLEQDQRVALDSALYQATVRRQFELEKTLPGPTGRIAAIAMSADGKHVAVSDDQQQVWVYDLAGSEPPVNKPAPAYPVLLRFTDDAKQLLLGCYDGTLRTLDTASLREVDKESIQKGAYYVIRLSADRRHVITVDPTGAAYHVVRGSTAPPVPLGRAPNWGVHFSPDSKRIALARPEGLVVLDAETDKEEYAVTFDGKGESLWGLSRDGNRVLLNSMNGPFVVDLTRRAVVGKIEGDTAETMFSAIPTAVGWLYAGATKVRLWDGGRASANETLWEGAEPSAVATSANGRRVAVAHRGTVRVWSVRDKNRARSVPADAIIREISYAKDGKRLVFTTVKGSVYLTEVGEDLTTTVLAHHEGGLCTMAAMAPDGRRAASVSTDRVVRVFDLDRKAEVTSRQLTPLEWPLARCSSLLFSADGSRLLATAPDGRIHVLDAGTLELERVLASYAAWAPALRFSSDGKLLLVGDAAGQAIVFDAKTFQLIHTKYDGTGSVSDVRTTSDGSILITASEDGWVRRYEMKTQRWRPLLAQRAHEAWVNRLVLSPDGKVMLTTSDDHTVKLWTPVEGELLRVLHFDGWVGGAAFAPTGGIMAMNDGASLVLLPDLRDILASDGKELFERAKQQTGQHLVGFELEPIAKRKREEDAQTPEAWQVPPREWQGSIVSYPLATKSLPPDATVELIREDDLQSFTPKLIQTVKDGKVTFEVPDGIERFALRILVGKDTTYLHSPRYHPGRSSLANHVPRDQLASLAARVSVELEPGKGHLIGQLIWNASDDESAMVPVGCAEVTESGGAKAYYADPGPDRRAELDARLQRSHPAFSFVYMFNMSPGEHELTIRVGDATLKTKVRIFADSTTVQAIHFPRDRFPTNPTPPKCMVDEK